MIIVKNKIDKTESLVNIWILIHHLTAKIYLFAIRKLKCNIDYFIYYRIRQLFLHSISNIYI